MRSMIKARKGFILQKMMDAYMIIAVGEGTELFHDIIQTNETGAFYWKMLEEGTTKEALIQAALERFEDLDEVTAQSDITEFLDDLAPALEVYS